METNQHPVLLLEETGGNFPYNDAKSGVVGIYWVIGAAFSQ